MYGIVYLEIYEKVKKIPEPEPIPSPQKPTQKTESPVKKTEGQSPTKNQPKPQDPKAMN